MKVNEMRYGEQRTRERIFNALALGKLKVAGAFSVAVSS